MDEVIYWKLYKTLKFDQTTKCTNQNETHNILWNLEIQTYHLIPARKPDLVIDNTNLRTCHTMDQRTTEWQEKKSEKRDKSLDLARKLRKLWNMKVTLTSIVIGALRMVPKILVRRLKEMDISGRIETIQTTALLRSARILRRVLCHSLIHCHSDSTERPSCKAGVKNSQGVQ